MANPWDPNAFKQVVGRDPNETETNYYSGAGDNWLDEVKGNTPDYAARQGQASSSPQVQPNKQFLPGEQYNQGSQTPSYYNASDPVQQSVWSQFQAKGIQPRDQADFQYWVDKINQSGGLANGYQNSGGTGTWEQRMASGNGGVGDYRTGGPIIQGGTMGGGGGQGGGGGFGAGGAFSSGDARSLYEKLLGRADQSLNFNPQTDPIARAQIDAFDASRQRGDRNTMSQLAEQSGPNANLEAAQRSAGEASGQATSGFTAQLGQAELNARRQEIQQALSGAMGLLTAEQQMQLQEEMSRLDRQQQESQFGRSLANNAYQFDINDQYRNSPIAWA